MQTATIFNSSTLKLLIGVIMLVLIAGCTSEPAEPTLADVMRQHSDDLQQESELRRQLAKDWEEGAELVRTGQRRLERGEERAESARKELEKGREDAAQGSREIAQGQRLMGDSERSFRQQFPELSLETGD